jgi:hypothetical protein
VIFESRETEHETVLRHGKIDEPRRHGGHGGKEEERQKETEPQMNADEHQISV